MGAKVKWLTLLVAGLLGASGAAVGSPAVAHERQHEHRHGRPITPDLPKVPTMTGSGGAVSSVDPLASQVGIDVLERGGNAADAAVALGAAALVVGTRLTVSSSISS